jgi:EmrB/QacA subfamily drug resistance transporter
VSAASGESAGTAAPPHGTTRGPTLDAGLLGLACGAMLVPLNSTMLAVALPSIMAEFAIGASTVAALVTLYLGAVAIALPASGSLGDRYGHRPVFLGGVAAFAIASALAAVAPSFPLLALFRVLQAVSGSLVSTSSVALLRMTAAPDRRGSVFGLFDGVTSVSAALGPLVGGLVVSWFGWRSMFLLAVPLAVGAFALVGSLLPAPAASAGTGRRRRLDAPGLFLLAVTLIALLVGIRGIEDGRTDLALALAAVPLLLVAFIAVETRTEDPAVDPALFRSRTFAAATVGVLGATVVLHGTFVIVPLLVDELLGGDATTSGLVLLGVSALWAVAAPLGGRLSDVAGRRRPAVAGMLLCAAALAGLWLVAAETTPLVVGGLMAVVGLGMGTSGSPRQTAALETVEPARAGMAAGTFLVGRYLGGALGATMAGLVLGGAVTAAGVTLGFGLLAVVALLVAAVSLLLPGRRTRTNR